MPCSISGHKITCPMSLAKLTEEIKGAVTARMLSRLHRRRQFILLMRRFSFSGMTSRLMVSDCATRLSCSEVQQQRLEDINPQTQQQELTCRLMESDLPVDTGIYSLIHLSQTLIPFVLFLLVAILSIRILAVLWPPSPPADFPSLCHNIKATYLQLLHHRMEGMRIRDQPQFPGLWPDSESALRTLISAVNETTCLVGKRQLVKLLHAIITDFTKLQEAIDEYHTEIDISCYRYILSCHCYGIALVTH